MANGAPNFKPPGYTGDPFSSPGSGPIGLPGPIPPVKEHTPVGPVDPTAVGGPFPTTPGILDQPGVNVYDNPQFSGPFTPGLTTGQVDALAGFNQLATPGRPLLQTQDLLSTIQLGLTGTPQGVSPEQFRTVDPRRSTEEYLFQSDLDRRLADINEQYSGLGLDPGSSDRNSGLAETAARESARFRLGQSEQQRQAAFQALPHLFGLEQLPFDRAMQQYSLNEASRQVADVDAQRRAAEFARTQGSGIQDVLSVLSGVPRQNTTVGPSPLSQISQFAGPLGSILAK